MRRRNFLAALLAAPIAPWRQIFTGIRTKLPYTTPTMTMTRLTNVDPAMFRVGDLVRITSGAGTGEDARIVAIVARDGADIIVTDNPRRMRRFIPPEWKNLARRA